MAKTHKGRAKRRITKKQKASRRRSIRRGGGYSDATGQYIDGVPGQQVHVPFNGPGKDCAGEPLRPGMLLNLPAGRGGLPGMSGGFRGGEGGGAAIGRGMDQTTGASAELKQIMGAAAGFANGPGAMRGGRYSMDPNGAAAFSGNGVGLASYAGIGRAPCELGSQNSLNPNPDGIQQLSTRPADMAGWSRTVNPMGGGMRRTRRSLKKRGGAMPLVGAPVVHVGDVNSMAYNAPTAGYGNMPLAPPVMNNPGILMQVPYDARAFNQACIKTGGGGPVAAMAGRFEGPTVADYMGKAVLPVKWGGTRRMRKSLKRGGAWVRADPAQIMLTPGSPVANQAGAFPDFQRIPLAAVSAGMPLSTAAQAGGKRKNKRRANRRARTQ